MPETDTDAHTRADDAVTLVSWNINSVRLRAPNIARFAEETGADIICLQETKCLDDQFPRKAFAEMGYPHLAILGQKGGHAGVAVASRLPLESVDAPPLCREGQARVQAVRVAGLELHNIYLPAGGDEPDPDANPKFAHKLDFLDCLRREYSAAAKARPRAARVLVGDLNVAPHPMDVWSHKQLLKVVCHTPEETGALEAARDAGGFHDIGREEAGEAQRLYTWWSYRARDWAASNRGRRLDHVWLNGAARERFAPGSFRVHLAYRGGWKPSDHAPVSVRLRREA